MTAKKFISIDPASPAVITYLAGLLNLTPAEIAVLFASLLNDAEAGAVEGLMMTPSGAEDSVLEGTVLTPGNITSTDSPAEVHAEIVSLLGNPDLEKILLSHITGFPIEDIDGLGGAPPKKEKPFKTGFNV